MAIRNTLAQCNPIDLTQIFKGVEYFDWKRLLVCFSYNWERLKHYFVTNKKSCFLVSLFKPYLFYFLFVSCFKETDNSKSIVWNVSSGTDDDIAKLVFKNSELSVSQKPKPSQKLIIWKAIYERKINILSKFMNSFSFFQICSNSINRAVSQKTESLQIFFLFAFENE